MTDQRRAWTEADAGAALMAVADFWTALEEDDDAAGLVATSALIHEELGTAPDFCDRMRSALGVSQDVCPRVGTSSKVRIVDRLLIFMCVDTGPEMKLKSLGS